MILNEYANDRPLYSASLRIANRRTSHQWKWLRKSSNELRLRLRTAGIPFTTISLQVPKHFTFQIALAHLPDWTIISTIYTNLLQPNINKNQHPSQKKNKLLHVEGSIYHVKITFHSHFTQNSPLRYVNLIIFQMSIFSHLPGFPSLTGSCDGMCRQIT